MNALGGDKSSLWHIEFYEDVNGRRPAESWMESLNEIKFAALDPAITHVLEVDGMNLAQTRWLKSLGVVCTSFVSDIPPNRSSAYMSSRVKWVLGMRRRSCCASSFISTGQK